VKKVLLLNLTLIVTVTSGFTIVTIARNTKSGASAAESQTITRLAVAKDRLVVGDSGPITLAQHTPHFHAKGTHQCQSKTSIGHTCVVEGEFLDCDEAYHKLKMDDCCGQTKEGGASSGFTLDSCVPQ
jgi:hypothetical protein